jgi:hypothetical protein
MLSLVVIPKALSNITENGNWIVASFLAFSTKINIRGGKDSQTEAQWEALIPRSLCLECFKLFVEEERDKDRHLGILGGFGSFKCRWWSICESSQVMRM